jgi:hypothetical protein
MGTNCASLLADMFLHTNEAEFPRGFLKNKDRKLAQSCNSNFRYIVKWLLRYSQNIVKMTLNTSYSSLIRFFGFQYLLLPGSSPIYILHGLTLFATLVVVKGRIRHRLRTVHFVVTTDTNKNKLIYHIRCTCK